MAECTLREQLLAHLDPPTSGKVRDTYLLPRGAARRRLVVTSDRVSIFDFKLGFPVPGKGAVLNAFNIAARLHLKKVLPGIKQDLVAFGADIDRYLPSSLRGNRELQRCGIVVDDLEMHLVEAVLRGHLTGGGYREYQKTGEVSGHRLPSGLPNGAPLDPPLFTPTTKAAEGHDLPLHHSEVQSRFGPELVDSSLSVFRVLQSHARKCGFIMADTKLEWGTAKNGELVLADEVGTPDSSRFWSAVQYDLAFPKYLPDALDKEILRNWGRTAGIDRLEPKDAGHCKTVHAMEPPEKVIKGMMFAVHELFQRLWGISLPSFQARVMNIVP